MLTYELVSRRRRFTAITIFTKLSYLMLLHDLNELMASVQPTIYTVTDRRTDGRITVLKEHVTAVCIHCIFIDRV